MLLKLSWKPFPYFQCFSSVFHVIIVVVKVRRIFLYHRTSFQLTTFFWDLLAWNEFSSESPACTDLLTPLDRFLRNFNCTFGLQKKPIFCRSLHAQRRCGWFYSLQLPHLIFNEISLISGVGFKSVSFNNCCRFSLGMVLSFIKSKKLKTISNLFVS